MIVVVGTSNPVKVEAVRKAFLRFFKDVEVIMHPVSSKAPPQPIGLAITIEGAISRAKRALEVEERANLGVGIEAGIVPVPYAISGYMDQQFAAIVDRLGRTTIGGGPAFEYPSFIINRILRENMEVNTIMAEITGEPKIGHKGGAISYFSKNILNREIITEIAVIMALIPRLNENLYF
ncbi:MAG: inosine/xanthosine triphosphatase [Candidatus Methanomethyliaceae archaeon]|nr:inosine/xanthosine triphosphatase [Candidatus Methanomethyliaceae archaeon]MDW7970889.1 inosine/xanthosine triphosphatase [Nitrososphaerota archaeon]